VDEHVTQAPTSPLALGVDARAAKLGESVLRRRRVALLRAGVWALGLWPTLRLGWLAWRDGLGANPIEALLHRTGDWTLVFLLVTLAVTPLRRLTGWNVLIQIRRPLGLFAFYYASLHFLGMYLVLDQTLDWEFIWEDIAERPFITVGFAAWLILVPLALTSTRSAVRRLGRRWALLHRGVYVATALGLVHFYWKVKADTFWPLVAIGVFAVLMAARWWARRVARPVARGT